MTNREWIFNTEKIPACIWKEIKPFTTVPYSPRVRVEGEMKHGALYLKPGQIQMDLSYFWECGFGGFASLVLHECIHWEQELRYGRLWFTIRYWIYPKPFEVEANRRAQEIIPAFGNHNSFLMDSVYQGD